MVPVTVNVKPTTIFAFDTKNKNITYEYFWKVMA